MRKYYFFDFDGTLTEKDTMFLFLKFCNPVKFRFSFLKFVPLFTLVKLKLMRAESAKKAFISTVIKGYTQEKLAKLADDFFEKFHTEIMRQNAVDFLKNRPENSESFLVTASLDIWTRPFAEHYTMKLIATKAEYKDGVFTGNFATKNCNGQEKVNRIIKETGGKFNGKTIAFGDTNGDKPMLSWANEGHFKFFH